VDVLSDATLSGDAGCLLIGGGHALLAEPDDSLLHVAAALGESLLAVHHAGTGLVADSLDVLGGDGDGGLGRLFLLLLLGSLLLLLLGLRLESLGLGLNLGGEVLLALLHALAEVVLDEAADGDLLSNLRGGLLDEFLNSLGGVLDEVLLEESLLVDHLVEAALDNLLADVLRLGLKILHLHLDILLGGDHGGIGIIRGHVLDILAGGNLHGDVLGELLEPVTAGDKVSLAVDLDNHTEAGATVDVGADGTLSGDAGCLLIGGGDALLAEPDDSLLEVAAALGEGLLAVHHAGAGGVADSLDVLGGDGGTVSLGGLSLGSFSLGGFSLGGFSLGSFSLGSLGGGGFSLGGLSLGGLSLGGLSLGGFSLGGLGGGLLLLFSLLHGGLFLIVSRRELGGGDPLGLECVLHGTGTSLNLLERLLDDGGDVNLVLHGELHLGAVDAHHLDGDGVANLAKFGHLDVVVVGHLGDVHETLDTLHDLDEGAEGLDGLDLAVEGGAGLDRLDLLGVGLGRSLLSLARGKLSLALFLLGLVLHELLRGGRGLHGEGDATLLGVDGLDPDGDVLVCGDDVGDVLDESILELGDVNEAVVLGAKVDEAAVLLHALHFALVLVADGDVGVLHGDVLLR